MQRHAMNNHFHIHVLALPILVAAEPKTADDSWLHRASEILKEISAEALSGAGLLAILVGIIGVLAAWQLARRTDKKIEGIRQIMDVLLPTIVGAARPTLSSAPPSVPEPTDSTIPEETADAGAPAAESRPGPPLAPPVAREEQTAFGAPTVQREPQPQRDFVGALDLTGDGHLDFLNQSGDARSSHFRVTTLDSAVGSGTVSRTLSNSSGSNFFVEPEGDGTIVATLDIGPNDDRVLRRYRWAAGKFEQLDDRPASELSVEDLARYQGPPPWGTDAEPV